MNEALKHGVIGIILAFTLGVACIFERRLNDVYREESIRDKELSSLKQRNEEFEMKENTLKADLSSLKTAMEELAKVVTLKVDVSSLKTSMEKLTEVETLKVELSSLKTAMEELTEEIKIMKNTPSAPTKFHSSCMDILKYHPGVKGNDGVYQIYVNYQLKSVYCDMSTDGGGWTVIQRRKDGSTDFYRRWEDYKQGFGDPSKEYWIGNDAIHDLTKTTQQELRIDLQRFNDDKAYDLYSIFEVGDEINKYKLSVGGYTGTAGDSLAVHNGMKFSTYDHDNNKNDYGNCAEVWHGAWWYEACHSSNLNGEYAKSAVDGGRYAIWFDWKGKEALKATLMMIRLKG